MNDELLEHYRRELSAIRKLAGEFAEDYPAVASQLKLGPEVGSDPHVERMIMAFAFLTARVRQKLDDDFPEVAGALLGALYPHYLAPIPSMAIVELQLDRSQGALVDGYPIKRGQELETEAVRSEACRYRTCFPVTLWPIEVVEAGLGGLVVQPQLKVEGANAMLRLKLKCFAQDMTFSKLKLNQLRFYLNGQIQHVCSLYELLFNHLLEVTVSGTDKSSVPVPLGAASLRPVGFDPTEAALPFGPRSFPGYRLITEYFAFPQKFCFLDFVGLGDRVRASLGNEIELCLYLSDSSVDLERAISSNTFRLGCTPVINLFKQIADPIVATHEEFEYRVVPDVRRRGACEVYSIESVTGTSGHGAAVVCDPLFSLKHSAPEGKPRIFWSAARRPSSRSEHEIDRGTEVYLSLVDLDLRPTSPNKTTLMVETECLNRDLPNDLKVQPKMDLVGGGPIAKIVCLVAPTPTRRPSLGRGALWKVISHLTLNHLSVAGSGESTEALREILRLYDFNDTPETQAKIAGIVQVATRPSVCRVGDEAGGGVCRGVLVEVEFDEERYADKGLFLFANVLERFLGMYCGINSFIQLSIRSKQRGRTLHVWRPRTNNSQIL